MQAGKGLWFHEFYRFIYGDGTGRSVTNIFKFADHTEALDAACLTFERFGVEVVCAGETIGRFPPNCAIGIGPRDDIAFT